MKKYGLNIKSIRKLNCLFNESGNFNIRKYIAQGKRKPVIDYPPMAKYLYAFKNNKKYVQKHLFDFLLNEIYSQTVIIEAKKSWQSLPFYIKESIDEKVQDIILNCKTNLIGNKLKNYQLDKAINILIKYDAYKFKDRMPISLLSEAGKKELLFLQNHQQDEEITTSVAKRAFFASNKILLNLDLFISMDHLKDIPKHWVYNGGAENTNQFVDFSEPIALPLSTGCTNNCSHCGFRATGPVEHTPYPIYLKAYKAISEDASRGLLPFANNDPLEYKDDVINADVSDVMRNIRYQMRAAAPWSLYTKGVKNRKQAIAFAKMSEITNFRLSLVDVPGENVEKNLEDIKFSLEIKDSIPRKRKNIPDLTQIDYLHLKNKQTIDPIKELDKYITDKSYDFLVTYNGIEIRFHHHLVKRGRINDFVDDKDIEQHPFYDGFCPDNYVVSANGIIYDVYADKKIGESFWQPVADIYNIQSIKNIKYLTKNNSHPTKLIHPFNVSNEIQMNNFIKNMINSNKTR